jgi:hypothetical protein
MRCIGIDLGQKGAIAVQTKAPFKPMTLEIFPFWDRHGGTRLRAATDEELVMILRKVLMVPGERFVAIEHPILMPKNGKKAIAGLFEHFGLIKGVCTALLVDQIWLPTPRQWKKEASAPGSDKAKMMSMAQKLFKSVPISEMTADAVLISEACRLHFR